MGKGYIFQLFLYTLGLAYLHPVKVTPSSDPGIGTARQYRTASELCSNIKGYNDRNLCHNTIYVAAVCLTECSLQDIWKGTTGEPRQVFQGKSVNVE